VIKCAWFSVGWHHNASRDDDITEQFLFLFWIRTRGIHSNNRVQKTAHPFFVTSEQLVAISEMKYRQLVKIHHLFFALPKKNDHMMPPPPKKNASFFNKNELMFGDFLIKMN